MSQGARVVRCQAHPTYTGLSDPRENCDACKDVHAMRGAKFERTIVAKTSRNGVIVGVRWGAW